MVSERMNPATWWTAHGRVGPVMLCRHCGDQVVQQLGEPWTTSPGWWSLKSGIYCHDPSAPRPTFESGVVGVKHEPLFPDLDWPEDVLAWLDEPIEVQP